MTLRRISPGEVRAAGRAAGRAAADPELLAAAAKIVDDVRARGTAAVREHAERLGDVEPGAALLLDRAALERSLEELDGEQRALLERTAGRVRAFAEAQRAVLGECRIELPGGAAGHRLEPLERVGCYAPGGRFPLPSSVLMTAVPARAAGCKCIWVASPRPARATRAAAALAGADGLLAVGGAQAIAALAFGIDGLPAVDFVCGPGNTWVTAAKRLVFGDVGIDMLAGPSELAVLADAGADAADVAADLLAQAEHDPHALPVLVTTAARIADEVDRELEAQRASLPESAIGPALERGFCVLVRDMGEALLVCDRLAPEHLALHVANAAELERRVRHAGAVFVGADSAEVLGDYGVGPNHVLPTGGGARFRGGLSVFDFLRVRTWLALDDRGAARELVDDAVRLARVEGLEAHARSAERRRE